MAAGTRTLKLSLLADVAGLSKGLDQGSKEVESFGSKVGDFGKKAGLAFAVAGAAAVAYAGKLLIDGVKAAAEDEAAQAKLAATLMNVTGATKNQTLAVESYITKTSIANNVTDDLLRPSLERLVRATGDVSEAQRLQGLALDISAGSGKSLEAVSMALGKAFEGNAAGLGKLGVGLSAAELKTMSFDDITKTLSNTFGGQAAIAADTFSGKLGRLGIVFNEAKETVGSFVIDAITPMLTLFIENVVPVINELATSIGEKLAPVFANLATFFTEVLIPVFKEYWEFITKDLIPAIVNFFEPALAGISKAFGSVSKSLENNRDKLQPLFDLFKEFFDFASKYLAPFLGNVLGKAFEVLGSVISGVIGIIANLISIVDSAISGIKTLIGLVSNINLGSIASRLNPFGGGRASGGSVMSGTSYLVGERGAELFTPSSNGTITPNSALGGGNTYNITVNGALDGESVSRQIIDLLNRSQARGTQGASQFAFTA
jgi:hypothetical protein